MLDNITDEYKWYISIFFDEYDFVINVYVSDDYEWVYEW